MMILMFLTGAGFLYDIMDGLQMPWGSYVQNLVESRWIWRHQDPCQRWMTFQEFLLELDDDFDIPDWGWFPWWHYGWSANALRELCLKFGWNLMNLKASRTLSEIDDILGILAGDDDDFAFLTGAGVLDDIMDGLQLPWGSYVLNLVEIRWVWRHQEPCQRSMTFQEMLLELMMILTFLTGAGVLDEIMDCPQMPWESSV